MEWWCDNNVDKVRMPIALRKQTISKNSFWQTKKILVLLWKESWGISRRYCVKVPAATSSASEFRWRTKRFLQNRTYVSLAGEETASNLIVPWERVVHEGWDNYIFESGTEIIFEAEILASVSPRKIRPSETKTEARKRPLKNTPLT